MWTFKRKYKYRKEYKTFTTNEGGWGNNIEWMACIPEKGRYRVSGHKTPMPVEGDKLTALFESGLTREFVFIKMDYCGDPDDMFFASLAYMGEE